ADHTDESFVRGVLSGGAAACGFSGDRRVSSAHARGGDRASASARPDSVRRGLALARAACLCRGRVLCCNGPFPQAVAQVAKLGVVLLLVAYHLYCGKLLSDFARDRNTRSHLWYRWFNEVPVAFLAVAVVLAVVKPF